MDLLRNLFTGKDNKTWDLGRVLWTMLVLQFACLTAFQALKAIWLGQSWDALGWATAGGTILGAGAATLWMKRSTEPGHDDKNPPSPPAPLLALILLAGLALPGAAAAVTLDPSRIYFQPTRAQLAVDFDQIQIQQRFFDDAAQRCIHFGGEVDCARAYDLAVWPLQRAWLLDVRALSKINAGELSARDQVKLHAWLDEAMLWASRDPREELHTVDAGACRASIAATRLELLTRIKGRRS